MSFRRSGKPNPPAVHPEAPIPQFYDRELEEGTIAGSGNTEPDPVVLAAPLPTIVPAEPEPVALADRPARPQLASQADADAVLPLAAGPASDHGISHRTYGQRPTFATVPWWSNRGWWKVAENGEANDVRAHVGTVGDLAVAGASLRGNRHRNKGEANQDSFAFAVARRDDQPLYVVVAVTDGLGSSPYSAFGARLVAQAVVDRLAVLLVADDRPAVEIVQDGISLLLREITTQVCTYRLGEYSAPPNPFAELQLNDLQCTLTFAVLPCTPNEGNDRRLAVFGQVGDSPAFVLQSGSWVRVDVAKDGDGIWDTSTAAALGAESAAVMTQDLAAGDALLLTTDGVGNFMWFDGRPTVLGEDLARIWAGPVNYLDFVRDVGFELTSADDDRTAVMVWIKGPPS